MTETDDDIWGDDLLGRREFADFLTKALVARTELISAKEGQRGWTVALDAAWGAGKSFFIKRWTDDLRRQGYPVVLFDAWENDIGEESSVALMAEINEEMKQWIGKLSKAENIENKARELVVDVGRKLRKSVMPVAKVVASGLLKKAIGVGLQEILDGSDSADDADSKEEGSLASSADDVLDKVFEVSIEEHQRRKSDIRDFKKALVDLIDLIHKQAGAKYPLFVFIDELDRCRPTYAISMLEEVKHIFGMDKVCFVVSTNLSQLRHSVCAVYGQDFDAEMYLKRFFDQSIELPIVVSEDHVEQLYFYFEVISSNSNFIPLPRMNEDQNKIAISAIAWVFRACGLDARSQRQVFQMADSAAASIKGQIHTVFLFFLCALFQKNKNLFEELEDGAEAKRVCDDFFTGDESISYIPINVIPSRRVEYNLSTAISQYVMNSRLTWSQVQEIGYEAHSSAVDNLIQREIIENYYQFRSKKLNEISHLSSYFNFVRYAGYLSDM